MGFISPQQVNDDPKLFLSIPHELHKSILEFQEMLFPGFKQKLIDQKIHCKMCDGDDTVMVFNKKTLRMESIVGYIGDKDKPELFRTERLSAKEKKVLTDTLAEIFDS